MTENFVTHFTLNPRYATYDYRNYFLKVVIFYL